MDKKVGGERQKNFLKNGHRPWKKSEKKFEFRHEKKCAVQSFLFLDGDQFQSKRKKKFFSRQKNDRIITNEENIKVKIPLYTNI